MITADNVVGPADQGLDPGAFNELLQALLDRATYANVHTEVHVAGEIRGQIMPKYAEGRGGIGPRR